MIKFLLTSEGFQIKTINLEKIGNWFPHQKSINKLFALLNFHLIQKYELKFSYSDGHSKGCPKNATFEIIEIIKLDLNGDQV